VFPSLTLLTALVAAPAPVPEAATELWQVAPDTSEKPWTAPAQPGDKTRAVVLIHGLFVHVARPARATQPWRREWQEAKGELAKALGKDSDVFAFAYAQTAAVDEIARGPGLKDAVARLRKAGYKEVVLIGHSAGGVLARLFVEYNPGAGVTKVIAVSAPFAGVEIAAHKIGYPKVQAPFVESLTPAARAAAAKANPNPLGRDVPIVSVVSKLKHLDTDGLVAPRSQWPEELQRTGVPAVHAPLDHFSVMYHPATAKVISELVRNKLVRWSPAEVEQARKALFGETCDR
jgi:pimeloyl-ACP methyl ester carboxylesterase